ncbi:MAG: hypothetical protein AAGE52_30425 [Myxococcota bacterium]
MELVGMVVTVVGAVLMFLAATDKNNAAREAAELEHRSRVEELKLRALEAEILLRAEDREERRLEWEMTTAKKVKARVEIDEEVIEDVVAPGAAEMARK